ncbi:MAG: LON peptidase substrate-binding domain-containing protein [Candidatus Actinomarinales bacterium]|nr:LON peptidase substrate-binding domain-containing protein [Candidatus Actinomarinales bacterium]
MLVDFPIFGAGINYFPTEISALRVFEPRYLLLIGDVIKNDNNFLVSKNLEELHQTVSEVRIIEHQDISNAEQLIIIECLKLHKLKKISINSEYPLSKVEEFNEIGLPPSIDELATLEKYVSRLIAKLIESGINLAIPEFMVNNENRLRKLHELCITTPLDLNTRYLIIDENDLYRKYEILNNFVQKQLKNL